MDVRDDVSSRAGLTCQGRRYISLPFHKSSMNIYLEHKLHLLTPKVSKPEITALQLLYRLKETLQRHILVLGAKI